MVVVASAAAMSGKYNKHIDVNPPDWKVGTIGPMLHQATVMILPEIGDYPTDRKINSRWTDEEEECGSTIGNGGEEWNAVHIDGLFLAPEVGIMSRVCLSPFWEL